MGGLVVREPPGGEPIMLALVCFTLGPTHGGEHSKALLYRCTGYPIFRFSSCWEGKDAWSQRKCRSERCRWAREELNLRPLPCQIPRAPRGQYVAPLRIVDDVEKATGERRCQRPVIRRSVTLFQRSCCFLRRSVAARLLPDASGTSSPRPLARHIRACGPITADMADELQFGRLLGTVIDCCSPLARGPTAAPPHRAVHAEPRTSRSTPRSAAMEARRWPRRTAARWRPTGGF
jgi:hypothetical protein